MGEGVNVSDVFLTQPIMLIKKKNYTFAQSFTIFNWID